MTELLRAKVKRLYLMRVVLVVVPLYSPKVVPKECDDKEQSTLLLPFFFCLLSH